MSDTEDNEDYQYAEQANKSFGPSAKFASSERTQARLKKEKRAGRSSKQRANARIRAPRKPVSYRFELALIAQLKALGKHLGKTDTEVMELAISKLAASEGISRG